MKIINLILYVAVSTTSLNYEKDNAVLQPCKESKIISEFSDRAGTIQFNQATGYYSVSYHIPNTYDSTMIGIFCNLPEDFKKDGLAIRYSGKYKEREKDNNPIPAGYESYSLELTQIALINSK